jgi:hypothetical protein
MSVQWLREFQLLNAGVDEKRSHTALFFAKNIIRSSLEDPVNYKKAPPFSRL